MNILNKKITLLLLLTFSGCLFVKHPDKGEVVHNINLSPKPEIEMSALIVRSEVGDMVSFIPKNWFFVDIENEASPNVIAVAVNPDYTLSAIFTKIRKTDRLQNIVEKEGMQGLARTSLALRQQKTAGTVRQVGAYEILQYGMNEFVRYDFAPTGESMVARAVVFISAVNEYYEFSLLPMNIIGKPLPPNEEVEKIFRSILATIKYR